MIQIIGPNWPSVNRLREALREVSEEGQIRWATGHGNKYAQLDALSAGGVIIPHCTEDIKLALDWAGTSLVYGRRYHHKEGKDIVIAGPGHPVTKRWRGRDFWTKYVPSVEEWRIHIFNGKSIARSKKVAEVEPQDVSTPFARMVRSYDNGWRFRHSPEPPRGIRDFAKKMVKACGYLYGACDILVKEDGSFCALEVNTSPAMDNYTLGKYVQAIRRRFRQ